MAKAEIDEAQKKIQSELLEEFGVSVAWASRLTNLSMRRVSSLYELYIMKIILEVATEERGAELEFIENGHRCLQPSAMKTGPHRVREASYTYARLYFPHVHRQGLEVHTGLKFRGKSGISTECDVAVLGAREANRSRECLLPKAQDCSGTACCDPRDHRILFSVECKCYTKNIGLEMAREFVGLSDDLAVPYKNVFYVVSYPIVRNGCSLLDHHRSGKYFPDTTPTQVSSVEALKVQIRSAFEKHGY